jgi:DNA-binding beta-propeller fold protein YncE
MGKLQVLSCPSCGASLSVEEGAATAQCQFCGNTVVVPEEYRRPSATPRAAPPRQSGVMVGGMPFLDQLPKLREMGDLVREGRRDEAKRLYQELFGASEQEASGAIDQLAAGQPVMVHHVTTSQGTSLDDSGFFRFDNAGLPQIQVSGLGAQMFGRPSVPTATYTSAPVVVTNAPARRAGGCVAMLIVLVVFGLVAIGLLAAVAGFLPFLAIPGLGDLDQLIPGLGDSVAEVTNTYPRVVLEFGGQGTGAGLFADARHVGVDAEGKIYVADYSGGRIQVFDSQGQFQTQWVVGNGDDDVYITGMAVARDGSVFLVYGSDLFRHDGETGEVLEQVEYVDGWGFGDVATLPDGGWVAAWYKNRDDIIVFDRNGAAVTVLQEAISGVTGDTEVTIKVATDGVGNIFALGQLSESIFHFSPDGDYVNRIGSGGDEAGQFKAAGDIAVDNQSRIYVSDISGIQVFAPDGRYLSTFDTPTRAYAYGLAFDDDNFLYLVSNNTVYKYQLAADE